MISRKRKRENIYKFDTFLTHYLQNWSESSPIPKRARQQLLQAAVDHDRRVAVQSAHVWTKYLPYSIKSLLLNFNWIFETREISRNKYSHLNNEKPYALMVYLYGVRYMFL